MHSQHRMGSERPNACSKTGVREKNNWLCEFFLLSLQIKTFVMNIDIYADQRAVTEGEVVEIHWVCDSVENLKLTLDNGIRATTIDLDEPNGSKKFRLNRSKGKTKFTLTATDKGKMKSESAKVRGKPMPTTKAETIYEERPHRNPFRRQGTAPKGRMGEWWNNQRNRFSYVWRTLSAKKQMAFVVLTILCAGSLLSLLWPGFRAIAEIALLGYLALILLKK